MKIELETHLVLPRSTPCVVCGKAATGREACLVKPVGIAPGGERLGLICPACLKARDPAAYEAWKKANPNICPDCGQTEAGREMYFANRPGNVCPTCLNPIPSV